MFDRMDCWWYDSLIYACFILCNKVLTILNTLIDSFFNEFLFLTTLYYIGNFDVEMEYLNDFVLYNFIF